MSAREVFDYVIVGAGSAGCVLASRLSADGDARVCVLEAGPPDHAWAWQLHMPAALAHPLANDRYNWFYRSEPEPHMDGRRMYCPRGRVLGGSSSINGMAYMRGHARDYDRWAQAGLAGWRYADVLPYFKRAETREAGADDYRGGEGPLHVSTGACANPLYRAFLDAGVQAGYPFTADMNGCQQEGVGPMDMTTHAGRRWSAASAYLRPAMRRSNLTVRTRALSLRICFEGGRAIGVDYAGRQRGPARDRRARGDPVRRRDQLASAPDALRHRRCRSAAAARHSGGRTPAGSRRKPAGPSRDLRPACLHPADLAATARKSPGTSCGSASSGSSSSAAWPRPATSRRAASSARAPASSIPTCSIISYRSR